MGEQRERDAVVLPTERFAQRAQELDRALPAVAARAADVADVHRRRPVLEDDEVHSRGADDRGRGLRPRDRPDGEAERDQQAEPEQQFAEERDPLADRHQPAASERRDVGAPPPCLPQPQQQQPGRDGEQRHVLRRPELDGRQARYRHHCLKQGAVCIDD